MKVLSNIKRLQTTLFLFLFSSFGLWSQSSPQFSFENNLDFSADTPITITKINVEGNRLTKPFIIFREMDLHEGDTVQFSNLNKRLGFNARRIFNTTLFINVKLLLEKTNENTVILKVIVRENWYLWAFPYIRFNDRNFNEWVDRGSDLRRLNYGAFIDHENLFGRLQKLEFVFETGFTDRFTLRYNIPYIDKSGNNGIYSEFGYQTLSNVAFNTVNNQLDFTYQDIVLKRQFNGKVKFRHRQGFYLFHYVELAYNTIFINDSLRFLNPFYLSVPDNYQQYATVGYTLRYDKRDNVNFTLKGRTCIADIRKMGILPNDNFDSWLFRVACADYYPLTKKWYANYILKLTAYSNPNVPYNIIRGIGYDENILRGYDLLVANGTSYVSGRVNLKREVYKNTFHIKFIKWRQFNTIPVHVFLNAFSDWGYAYNKFPERLDNSLNNKLLQSFGVGLELNTVYNATIRFNVSRNGLNQTNFFINFQKDIWTRWN